MKTTKAFPLRTFSRIQYHYNKLNYASHNMMLVILAIVNKQCFTLTILNDMLDEITSLSVGAIT